MERPLYMLEIDEENDSVVDAIALVEYPAIEEGFLAFSENSKRFEFNEDKMELVGPAMIPDIPIYRFDPKMGEYDVMFSVPQIKHFWQVYMKRGHQHNINIEHSATPAGAYVFNSWFVDADKNMPGKNYPIGTLIVEMKVDNKDTWRGIKAGKLQGFSIEGIFKMLKVNFNKNVNTTNSKEGAEIADLFDSIATKLKNYK